MEGEQKKFYKKIGFLYFSIIKNVFHYMFAKSSYLIQSMQSPACDHIFCGAWARIRTTKTFLIVLRVISMPNKRIFFQNFAICFLF